MALLWSEGVRTGRITPQSFVALTSTNAAKMYGLYPRKGSIAIGSDADLVIWEEGQPVELNNQMLLHNVDYTPYEGMWLSAWPAMTLSRGELVWMVNQEASPGVANSALCPSGTGAITSSPE
jgi:dihydropyrimidinase